MVNLGSPAKMYLLLVFSIFSHQRSWRVIHFHLTFSSGFATVDLPLPLAYPKHPSVGKAAFPDHVAWISFLLMDEIRIYLVLSSQVLRKLSKKTIQYINPYINPPVFSSVFPKFPSICRDLHEWGIPNSWRVFVMEKSIYNCMIWGQPHGLLHQSRGRHHRRIQQLGAQRARLRDAPRLQGWARRHGAAQAWVHLETVAVKRENMKAHNLLAVM